MKKFHDGSLQVLCNVGCLTEGVDVPAAEIVVMGRPTKSRSLYAQMAGRILRPLPNLVDHLDNGDDRKSAIAQSAKPSALIIDFAGNSGRHKLVTSADILGGNVSEEAIELANRKARESGMRMRMSDELDEARKVSAERGQEKG
jgi:superfamily II DNA or RNA helicase